AVSFDETKQFLNGILAKFESGVLNFVATDGYRLALKRLSVGSDGGDFSLIIPFKAMSELNKILVGFDDQKVVSFNVTESQVSFSVDDFLLISRVIKGQFPDFRQVMPKHSDNLFVVSRSAMINASERAFIIASVSNNVVRLTFTDHSLVIRANAASMGEFCEELDVKRNQGEGEVKIAFNVKLVLDGIRGIDSDDIRIEFNQGTAPCVVRSVNDEDYLYIVMPIRTSDFQDDSAA
ncbi:DNA polymerase III subunit beta, partial [bacterium]|nr:DNA polymerase III subunit beta [bacterium]